MTKFLLSTFLILLLPLQAHALGINANKYFNKGLIYSGSKYPTSVANNAENLTPLVDIQRLKQGTSNSRNFFGLVEVGDASIDKAIKNAGITKISHIDINHKSVFIFWSKTTVNVYGE